MRSSNPGSSASRDVRPTSSPMPCVALVTKPSGSLKATRLRVVYYKYKRGAANGYFGQVRSQGVVGGTHRGICCTCRDAWLDPDRDQFTANHPARYPARGQSTA